MKCINCGAEFEAERCPECGLSRRYNKVLYRYYERHPEQEVRATHYTTAVKCVNCGIVFEHENCPRCGLSHKNNRVLYRYEERQREKESGDYRPKHKKKKKKPVYKKWWVWAIIGLLAIVLLTSIFGGNDDNKDAELNNDDKIANPEGVPSTDASAANVEKEVESEDTQTFGKYTLTNTLYVDGTKAARIDINEGNSVLLSETGGMYTGDGTALEEELLFYNLLLFPFAVENDGVSAMGTKDVNGEDVVWAHMFKNGELYTTTGEMPEGRYDNLDEEKLQGPDFAAVVDAATEFLTGKPLAETSTTTQESIEEHVLVDELGIKITATGIDNDGIFGKELNLLIENNSDTDLTTQVRAVSVNGYMVDTMMSTDVAAGKKTNDAITFMRSDFEKLGITEIADIEFYFHIFTSEGWDEYLDTELIQIKTSVAESYEYTYDDSGEELYNENGIRIVSKGVSDEESIFGPGLVLYIENLTEQSITVQSRDSSVNGFMIDAMLSEEVSAGKRAITAMTFFESALEENDISEITDLEFYFHIFTTDGWNTIVDTDTISVSA